ncbi:MAG: DEAD/DEAH box helicase [Metallibacterium scheffleri]|jgi:SWI/SNF-related matrix-associated actin-dependent regulator 1 of chromatin subfamily A|uniref:DEAD/DEAH box helicase n=1 Tax=Metallibacterium scheffleri TaxID=993689 RepID=UPI0026EFA2B1|nr:DEAD/DEAH box helicase [Metallibacterium scheffleri]MCK9367413.1 DEAD/DEAH box helicase [Metallibacterium scheffleri]
MNISISLMNNNSIALRFDFDAALVESVKMLPGRRWDSARRLWTVPASQARAVIVWGEQRGAQISADVRNLIEQAQAAVAASSAASADVGALTLPESIRSALRPYQAAGISYMLAHARSIQGDEMGLGKTVQALATIEHAGSYPALVICPASLVHTWRREAARWLPERRVQVVRDGKTALDADAEIIVLSYDIARRQGDALRGRRWASLVCDEAHFLKNKSQRTVAIQNLAASIPRRHLLTGTPITSRPADLIEPLRVLGLLDSLGGWRTYVTRYCRGVQGRHGWEIDGASNTGELAEKLRGIGMVRRLKNDVLADLPPKIRSARVIDLDSADRRAITATETELRALLAHAPTPAEAAQHRRDAIAILGRLRHAVGVAKIPAIVEAAQEVLDESRKVVVMAHHRDVLDGIESALRAAGHSIVRIDGETPAQARDQSVQAFQTDQAVRVFLGSITAAGVGITLTAASDIIIAEQDWTPATLDQAEDRLHRIGQAECVTALHILAAGTVDEAIAALIERKRVVIDSVLMPGTLTLTAANDDADADGVAAVLAAYAPAAGDAAAAKPRKARKPRPDQREAAA